MILAVSIPAGATDVTWADKVANDNVLPLEDTEKFSAADANEVKAAVNSKFDEADAVNIEVDGTTIEQSGTSPNFTIGVKPGVFALAGSGSAPTEVETLPGTLTPGTTYGALDTGDVTYALDTGYITTPGTFTAYAVPLAAPDAEITGAGPQNITFTYGKAATATTTADLCDDWSIVMTTAGALTLGYVSGDTTTVVVCSVSQDVFTGDTVASASYTPGTIEAVDDGGNMAAIADFSASVTNSSSESLACTTPTTGDTFNEGFLGAGYENTWSEVLGTVAINEDATLGGTPPVGSCTEGLYVNSAIGATVSTTTHDLGAAIANTNAIDVYMEFRLISSTLPADYKLFHVLQFSETSNPAVLPLVAYLDVSRESGVPKMRARASANSAWVPVTTGAWHTVKIHLDPTAASSYLQVDGGTQNTFTRGPSSGRYIHAGITADGNSTADSAIEYEIGRIWIDTP